jgi:hypothetical protein
MERSPKIDMIRGMRSGLKLPLKFTFTRKPLGENTCNYSWTLREFANDKINEFVDVIRNEKLGINLHLFCAEQVDPPRMAWYRSVFPIAVPSNHNKWKSPFLENVIYYAVGEYVAYQTPEDTKNGHFSHYLLVTEWTKDPVEFRGMLSTHINMISVPEPREPNSALAEVSISTSKSEPLNESEGEPEITPEEKESAERLIEWENNDAEG